MVSVVSGEVERHEEDPADPDWAQLPVLLGALEGDDLRLVALNETADDVAGAFWPVGSTIAHLEAVLAGSQLTDRVTEVYRTGAPYSSRGWRIPMPDASGEMHDRYFDLLYSPWRRPDGAIRGVLCLGIEVTGSVLARRRAEAQSTQWEQRLATSQAAMTALQGALLPAEVPVVPGLQIGARYLLSDADTAAGGDWFDAVPLPDGRVALVVGDVVGHGIGASAVMGRLRSLLTERLADGEELAGALSALDRSAGRIAGADATTVCVAVVDAPSGRVEYCTAGHPPPLVVHREEWRYLEMTGAGPLGSGAGFATATAALGDGDLILLYSDGLVERPGRALGQSTVEIGQAVADALAGRPALSGASTHAPDRVCEQALELVTRITGYADDITVLAARRIGPPRALTLGLRADHGAVWTAAMELERWLAAVDAGLSDQAALRHAVVELVSNTAEHAYRFGPTGGVAVHAGLDRDGYVTVVVSDEGSWRAPLEAPAERQKMGDSRLRGLGLAMVRDTVDEFALDHDTAGTTARLRRRLRRPAPLLAEAPGATGRQAVLDAQGRLVITPEGSDRLVVHGPLYLGTVAALESRLAMETRGGTRSLALDLSGLTHLASAGVQLLQEVRRTARAHGEELTLLASTGSVAGHVLGLVAADHSSEVHPSTDSPHWD